MPKPIKRIKTFLNDHPDLIAGAIFAAGTVVGVVLTTKIHEVQDGPTYLGILPLPDSENNEPRVRVFQATKDGVPLSKDFTMRKDC